HLGLRVIVEAFSVEIVVADLIECHNLGVHSGVPFGAVWSPKLYRENRYARSERSKPRLLSGSKLSFGTDRAGNYAVSCTSQQHLSHKKGHGIRMAKLPLLRPAPLVLAGLLAVALTPSLAPRAAAQAFQPLNLVTDDPAFNPGLLTDS